MFAEGESIFAVGVDGGASGGWAGRRFLVAFCAKSAGKALHPSSSRRANSACDCALGRRSRPCRCFLGEKPILGGGANGSSAAKFLSTANGMEAWGGGLVSGAERADCSEDRRRQGRGWNWRFVDCRPIAVSRLAAGNRSGDVGGCQTRVAGFDGSISKENNGVDAAPTDYGSESTHAVGFVFLSRHNFPELALDSDSARGLRICHFARALPSSSHEPFAAILGGGGQCLSGV